jgi:hypothetical protein
MKKLVVILSLVSLMGCLKDEPFCVTCTYECYRFTITTKRLESGRDTTTYVYGKSKYIKPITEYDFYKMILDSTELWEDTINHITIQREYVCQQWVNLITKDPR